MLLVVNAIAEAIAEQSKRTFARIGDGLLFGLFECGALALHVFARPVSDILGFLEADKWIQFLRIEKFSAKKHDGNENLPEHAHIKVDSVLRENIHP